MVSKNKGFQNNYAGLLDDGIDFHMYIPQIVMFSQATTVLDIPHLKKNYRPCHEEDDRRVAICSPELDFQCEQGFHGRLEMASSGELGGYEIAGPRVEWNRAGGVLQFEQDSNMTEVFFFGPVHQVSLVSFMFSIYDISSLEHHIADKSRRRADWLLYIEEESHNLSAEMDQYGDLLSIDVVDTYRNLSAKLLHFHQRLSESSLQDFVMKTDDDCFINNMEELLTDLKHLRGQNMVWWSRFRDQWLVERSGKWQENTYTADVYPMFACGAGNIISGDISQWLAGNAADLRQFQGEDVSMGIWLSALGVKYIKDYRWQCENVCDEHSYVVPELTPPEIESLWQNKMKCGNICGC